MSFVRVAAASDVPPGTAHAFTIGRYDVALFNAGGRLYALENSCPHQGGPIAEGWLEDFEITCPWHGWCFDVRSGKMTLGDFARIARFAVDVRGSDIYVSTEPLNDDTDA